MKIVALWKGYVFINALNKLLTKRDKKVSLKPIGLSSSDKIIDKHVI